MHWDETNSLPADYDFWPLVCDEPVNSTRIYMLVLYGLIRANGFKNIVELGVFRGLTTSILARAAVLNGGHVVAIDHERAALNDAAKKLALRGTIAHVTLMHRESWDTSSLKDLLVDFVFVDADHSFEGVRRDWLAWGQRVRVGGMMAFHDSETSPGVRQFVREGFPDRNWEIFTSPGDAGLTLLRRLA